LQAEVQALQRVKQASGAPPKPTIGGAAAAKSVSALSGAGQKRAHVQQALKTKPAQEGAFSSDDEDDEEVKRKDSGARVERRGKARVTLSKGEDTAAAATAAAGKVAHAEKRQAGQGKGEVKRSRKGKGAADEALLPTEGSDQKAEGKKTQNKLGRRERAEIRRQLQAEGLLVGGADGGKSKDESGSGGGDGGASGGGGREAGLLRKRRRQLSAAIKQKGGVMGAGGAAGTAHVNAKARRAAARAAARASMV
jgi:hypothetical protein